MGWCLLLASKHIRESSYSADEYAVALPCFGKVRTVFSCRLAFVPRKLAKSCERHDGPKIQIRSRSPNSNSPGSGWKTTERAEFTVSALSTWIGWRRTAMRRFDLPMCL